MKNLETITKSIQSKRKSEMDTQTLDITKLLLSSYDIRKTRNVEKMGEDLLRDGQLQPLTVNYNGDDSYTIVNGKTRYLKMIEFKDIFPTAKVEVYADLTELEQNYLNAQINISQNPLTPDEKRDFIIKYKDEIPMTELAKALGIGVEMLSNYLATLDVSDEVLDAWTPKSKGYGRGTVKIEELGLTVKSFNRKGVTPDDETLKILGETSEKMNLRRDEKRIQLPKIVDKVAEMKKNESLSKKFDTNTLINIASKEVLNSTSNGVSGSTLPSNSIEKYKIVDKLLKDSYEFSILLFAESLYRLDENGNSVESETKRIIDKVDELIVVGNEAIKLSEIEDYAKSLGKTITIINEDAIEASSKLVTDSRHGLIYINGASLYSQRPEFINFLKKKYPNSLVSAVVIDLLFGKSQVCSENRIKETITVYGGAESFDDIISFFKERVNGAIFEKYADTPQSKYIVMV